MDLNMTYANRFNGFKKLPEKNNLLKNVTFYFKFLAFSYCHMFTRCKFMKNNPCYEIYASNITV